MNTSTFPMVAALSAALGASSVQSQDAPPRSDRTDPSAQPVELGAVSWFRHHPTAARAARNSGRPVLAVFQEVPG